MICANSFLPAAFASAVLTLISAQTQAAPLSADEPGQRAAPASEETLRVAQTERRKRRRRSRRSNRETPGGASGLDGRYAILREKNEDVGCLLNLSRGGRAQLGPGCSDNGILIFDPIRWGVSGGKLVLRARAGHRISFSRKPDGTWQRDPAGRRALGLKKY